jgi:2-keto-3-deoxy-L-rhamnonate aldolase RhmA
MMVESQEAVDNLPALLKMPDIDAFYIGQNDLAESMGLKGQRKIPKSEPRSKIRSSACPTPAR